MTNFFSDYVRCDDRGFQYGDGIFTTIRVEAGKALLRERHIHRLHKDADRLGLVVGSFQEIADAIDAAAGKQPAGVVKVIITRGGEGRGYRCPPGAKATVWIGSFPRPDHASDIQQRGVTVRLCQMRLGINPWLAGIKHLNRLEQIMARREWDDPEIAEGLLCDSEGRLIEGTMSNVFLVIKGWLTTPDVTRCGVTGVQRAQVIAWASELGFECRVTDLSLADLECADEVFLTNSVIGIWPVRRCGSWHYPIGPLTRQMLARFAGLTPSARGDA